MPRLLGPDPSLPAVFTLARARAAGLTVDQIRYRLQSGRWTRLGRGCYRRADWAPDDLDEYGRDRLDHVHRVLAAVRAHPAAVVGYASAAAVQGLPLHERLPRQVTLVVQPGTWNGTRHGLVVRQLDLPAEHVDRHPFPITTAARTWFDLARTRSLADSLAAGDSGLRGGLLQAQDLARLVDGAGTMRGCRRAARALAHLDGTRESPLESASWAYFVARDLPLPRMQVEIRSASGLFVARVDFYWEQARLVGECDGRLKYADAEALYREKRREDAIRAEGERMIRWGWADLAGEALANRLRQLL